MNNRKIQRRAKRARNTFLRGHVNLIVKYVFKGTIITEPVKVRNILILLFMCTRYVKTLLYSRGNQRYLHNGLLIMLINIVY